MHGGMTDMFKISTRAIKDRIKQGGTITKREFDRLMVRGWKEHRKKYNSGRFYDSSTGGYCAIGVVAAELGLFDGYELAKTLPIHIWAKLASTSNNAGSKTVAIQAIKGIRW